jgi:hypothetical protein
MIARMDNRLTTLERAYQLAMSGEFVGIGELKARLVAEGYTNAAEQLYGPTLLADLRRLCAAARAKSAPSV